MKLLQKTPVRSLIVSTFTLTLDTLVLDLIKVVLGFDIFLLNLIYLSKVISSIVGSIASFYLQRNWAFKSHGSAGRSAVKFLLVVFLNFVTLNLFFSLYFQILDAVINSLAVATTTASILAGITQWLLSFTLYKYFVFKS